MALLRRENRRLEGRQPEIPAKRPQWYDKQLVYAIGRLRQTEWLGEYSDGDVTSCIKKVPGDERASAGCG